jgi:hypothetical protein
MEEVILLKEEMRRIVAFLEWERDIWMQRASTRTFQKDPDREGLSAYAKQQAALQDDMANSFKCLWNKIFTSESSEAY